MTFSPRNDTWLRRTLLLQRRCSRRVVLCDAQSIRLARHGELAKGQVDLTKPSHVRASRRRRVPHATPPPNSSPPPSARSSPNPRWRVLSHGGVASPWASVRAIPSSPASWRSRRRCPRLSGLPARALAADLQQQATGAPQPRGQAAHRCGWSLPQRGSDGAPGGIGFG